MPEYLRTLDRANPTRDMGEYTPQLGRRFRALKLWVLLRWFGLTGLRRRIEHHIGQARRLAEWVDADPDFERLAPVPFSVVCLRWFPAELAGRRDEPAVGRFLDEQNQTLMDSINRTGEVLLSHARLHGRFTIRVAFGNLRTTDRELARVWELLRAHAGRLDRAAAAAAEKIAPERAVPSRG
jgi:aromatic-L-amino-acid decarboxylase